MKGGSFLVFLQEIIILGADTEEAQELGIRNIDFAVLLHLISTRVRHLGTTREKCFYHIMRITRTVTL